MEVTNKNTLILYLSPPLVVVNNDPRQVFGEYIHRCSTQMFDDIFKDELWYFRGPTDKPYLTKLMILFLSSPS